MKKSEMDKKLTQLLGHCVSLRQEILALMEQAGMVFDLEEKPLPERLEMFGKTVRVARELGYLCPNVAEALGNYQGSGDSKAAEHVLSEMVRRYNLWPEIDHQKERAVRNTPTEVPERLTTGPMGSSGAWIGQHTGGLVFLCRGEASRPLAEELVRRFNLWPEIEKLCLEWQEPPRGLSTAACTATREVLKLMKRTSE